MYSVINVTRFSQSSVGGGNRHLQTFRGDFVLTLNAKIRIQMNLSSLVLHVHVNIESQTLL